MDSLSFYIIEPISLLINLPKYLWGLSYFQLDKYSIFSVVSLKFKLYYSQRNYDTGWLRDLYVII